MKVSYFCGSIIVKTDKSGYEQSLGFGTARGSKELEFNYPYGTVTPDEAAAVSTFVKTISDAYAKLTKQIDNVNADLKLEQYAPIVPPEVSTSGSDFDLDAESASPQSSDSPVGTTESESTKLVDSGDRLEEIETGSDKA